jgi:hypothetical protein
MEHYREMPQKLDLGVLLDNAVRQVFSEEECAKRQQSRK